MWTRGAVVLRSSVHRETLVWREGMEEWASLADCAAAMGIAMEPAPREHVGASPPRACTTPVRAASPVPRTSTSAALPHGAWPSGAVASARQLVRDENCPVLSSRSSKRTPLGATRRRLRERAPNQLRASVVA